VNVVSEVGSLVPRRVRIGVNADFPVDVRNSALISTFVTGVEDSLFRQTYARK